jgi:hypothetical protein
MSTDRLPEKPSLLALLRTRQGTSLLLLAVAIVCFWLPGEKVTVAGEHYLQNMAIQYSALVVMGIGILLLLILLTSLLRYGRWMKGLAFGTGLFLFLFAAMRIFRIYDSAGTAQPMIGLWMMAIAALAMAILNFGSPSKA